MELGFGTSNAICPVLILWFKYFQLHGVDGNIGKSKRVLTAMSRRINKNKWIIGAVIAVLVVVLSLILYFKLK
jgi:hypothetical protein